MITTTIYVDEFDGAALEVLGDEGDRLVESQGFVAPVEVSLHAISGEQIARSQPGTPILLGVAPERAWMLSQNGASLQLVDADGRQGEILLIVKGRIQ
jgi:hypothetical protein